MILVTVGTHPVGFDRLVKAADELAAGLDEPVVIQRGSSTHRPCAAEHFQWTGSTHMEQLIGEARLVIGHAAAGAIILALCHQKPLIIVPRLARFGESIDDHQQQLALALAAANKAIVVHKPSAASLRLAIVQATEQKAVNSGARSLVYALRQQLVGWQIET